MSSTIRRDSLPIIPNDITRPALIYGVLKWRQWLGSYTTNIADFTVEQKNHSYIYIFFSQKKYILLIVFFYFVLPETLLAEKAYFDLSDETINIETNFKGKEVIIFGLTDPSYDTALIIKGPNKDYKLSIKERLFGIWIETKQFTYKNIPSIFFIAASAPISAILEENIIRQRGLDFKNFDNNLIQKNKFQFFLNLLLIT